MYQWIRVLGDRQAGFVLGLVVVSNLIMGSLVMNHYPDLYPSFFHLDLNYFFRPARIEHLWLYVLLVTFSLFGINLLACATDSIIRLIAIKTGRLKAGAALLFHVALLFTMAAHLSEGFYASTQRIMIDAQGVDLPALGRVRVESLKNIHYPDQSLKDTEVGLVFDGPDGRQTRKRIAFNEPATFEGGRRQVVMLNGQMKPGGVVVSRDTDGREFRLEPGKPQPVGGGSLVLLGVFEVKADLFYAKFLWQPDSGQQQPLFMLLDPGQTAHSKMSAAGATYRFVEIVETPFIVAIIRHNPALPLAVIGLVLASAATLLLVGWLGVRNKIRNPKAA